METRMRGREPAPSGNWMLRTNRMRKMTVPAWTDATAAGCAILVSLLLAVAPAAAQAPPTPERFNRGLLVEGAIVAETEDASGLAISQWGGAAEVGIPLRPESRERRNGRSVWKGELSLRTRIDRTDYTMLSALLAVRISSRRIEAEAFAGFGFAASDGDLGVGPVFGASLPIVLSNHVSIVPRLSSAILIAPSEGVGLLNVAALGLRWQFHRPDPARP